MAEEPSIVVHCLQEFTHAGTTFLRDSAWEFNLCVGSALLTENKVCLCVPGDTVATASAAQYDQVAMLRWMNKGITLDWLATKTGVTKSMLSQVMHGKKKLSRERLTALLGSYGEWVRGHGCSS